MRTNEFPILTLDYLLARMWGRRWLVLLCGAMGVAFVLSVMFLAPKYQQEIELLPPAWEPIAQMNGTGLVELHPAVLYNMFFNFAVAKSTANTAWGQVFEKQETGKSRFLNPPVEARILGGIPKVDDIPTPRTMIVTGPSPDMVSGFLKELLTVAQRRVLENSQAKLQAGIDVHRSKILREIEAIENGDQVKIEQQRHADRPAALQGGRFDRVPLAFLDLSELKAELAHFENFELPNGLDIAVSPNFQNLDGPNNWYSNWHLLSGFLVGLFIGSWLSVAWRQTGPSVAL